MTTPRLFRFSAEFDFFTGLDFVFKVERRRRSFLTGGGDLRGEQPPSLRFVDRLSVDAKLCMFTPCDPSSLVCASSMSSFEFTLCSKL